MQSARPPLRDIAFVVVLHFDHLFHRFRRRRIEYFAVGDERVVRRRVDKALDGLPRMWTALRLSDAVISDVGSRAFDKDAPT
jgi:hypothetical protein